MKLSAMSLNMDQLKDPEILLVKGQRVVGLVAILLGLAIFAVAGRFFYNIYLHPLSSYPGPKLWAGSRLPAFLYQFCGQHPYKIRQLHEKHGPVVRVGPDEVYYTSPSAWKTIYGHRSSEMSKVLDGRGGIVPPPSGHTLLTAGRQDHSRLRRNVAHAFSDKALRDQESYIQTYVTQLLNGLRQAVASGEPQDMSKWYNFATFDIVSDLAFGEPFGCLETTTYHSWVTSIFRGISATPWIQFILYYNISGWLRRLLVPKGLIESRQKNYKTGGEMMDRRIAKEGEDRKDFTSYMLRHSDEKGLNTEELRNMASLLTIAGSETTATLLTGSTFHILNSPPVYERVVKEIRTQFDKDEDITLTSVNELKYLQAVLEESLRIHPPALVALPRNVPDAGEEIEGRWVPPGTAVGVHQYTAFSTEMNFHRGKDFIPERWLDIADGGSDEFAYDNKAAFQPFSFGPRNCVGKNLAYSEMRLIMARMLFNFDMKLDASSQNWQDTLTAPHLWDKQPLMIKLTPR